MEDRASRILLELNEEYIQLINARPYRRAKKIENIFEMIRRRDIQSLYNFLMIFINRRELVGNKRDNCEKIESTNFTLDENTRIAVYTSIYGNYDLPKEPAYISKQCDYYIITDQDIPESSIWKEINYHDDQFDDLNNMQKNRYVKLHPHNFFSGYQYSLYIDGNIRIMADVLPMVHNMGKAFIALHNHPLRDCIYKECKIFKYSSRLKPYYKDTSFQTGQYRKEGYPSNNGLYENTIIIRKHNEQKCIQLMDFWWRQLNQYSFRDQISLPYSIWKIQLDSSELHILGNDLSKNPRFRRYEHNIKGM